MSDCQEILRRARAIERTHVPLLPDEAQRVRFLIARESLRDALLRHDGLEAALATALQDVRLRAEAAAALLPSVT